MIKETPALTADEIRGLLWGDPNAGNIYRDNSTYHIYKIIGKSVDHITNSVVVQYVRLNCFESSDIVYSRPITDFEEPNFTRVKEYSVYLSHEEYKQYREKYR